MDNVFIANVEEPEDTEGGSFPSKKKALTSHKKERRRVDHVFTGSSLVNTPRSGFFQIAFVEYMASKELLVKLANLAKKCYTKSPNQISRLPQTATRMPGVFRAPLCPADHPERLRTLDLSQRWALSTLLLPRWNSVAGAQARDR